MAINHNRKLLKNNKGATLIEYGLLAALFAVIVIAAYTYLGEEVDRIFNELADTVEVSE